MSPCPLKANRDGEIMPNSHLEMGRVDAVAESGERFTLCQYLRITPGCSTGENVSNRIQPYWKTIDGLEVHRESDDDFLVKRNYQWIGVRVVSRDVYV